MGSFCFQVGEIMETSNPLPTPALQQDTSIVWRCDLSLPHTPTLTTLCLTMDNFAALWWVRLESYGSWFLKLLVEIRLAGGRAHVSQTLHRRSKFTQKRNKCV